MGNCIISRTTKSYFHSQAIVDLNDIKDFYFGYIGSASTHKPGSSGCYLISVTNSGNECKQYASDYNSHYFGIREFKGDSGGTSGVNIHSEFQIIGVESNRITVGSNDTAGSITSTKAGYIALMFAPLGYGYSSQINVGIENSVLGSSTFSISGYARNMVGNQISTTVGTRVLGMRV